jgi:carbonic anhydrase
MHMVFQTAEENPTIAVIGVFVDIDVGTSVLRHRQKPGVMQTIPTNATEPVQSILLDTLLSSVEEIATPGTKVTSKPLVFSELLDTLQLGSFQTYSGSLTTPPCLEGVNWNIATQKLKISAVSLDKVRNVVGFNSRFPQNGLGQPNALSF